MSSFGRGIQVFDTHSGGGGGAAVTANGISGDGTAGNPIVLGGPNGLLGDTDITGNGFTLSFETVNGQDQGVWEIDSQGGSQGYINSVSNKRSGDATGTVGGGSAFYRAFAGGPVIGQKKIELDTDTGDGITIHDAIDDIGLNGDVLFPISGPNQYAQYGNITAGAVNTANGVSGDGSAGSPIILGGNPLNQDTVVDALTHTLSFTRTVGGDNTSIIQDDLIGAPTIAMSAINSSNQGVILAYSGGGTSGAVLEVVDIGAGKLKQVFAQTNSGKGILITDDFDDIGLNSNTLFPISGNPGQYAQYGNLPGADDVAFAVSTISVTTNIVNQNSVASLAAYQFNIGFFANLTGPGQCHVRVTWTDQNFAVQTLDLPPLALSGDANYPPVTVICQVSTPLKIDVITDVLGYNATICGKIVMLNHF